MQKDHVLPLALVPTTAGTGSEVTPVSIITVGEEEKKGVSSAIILPDLAILDPDLTLGLPAGTTAQQVLMQWFMQLKHMHLQIKTIILFQKC